PRNDRVRPVEGALALDGTTGRSQSHDAASWPRFDRGHDATFGAVDDHAYRSRHGRLLQDDVESLGDARDQQRELHVRESEPDTSARTAPERQPCTIDRGLLL